MPSSDAPLLEVNDLATHYGPIQAIHSVSLEVHPGELVAIVGANGAGKTTLLRTISGIQAASGGSIRFDGEEITRLAAHKIVARGVCQVPEGRQMFAPLSVDDNLRLGGYSQRKDGGWVEEKIRDYPLSPEHVSKVLCDSYLPSTKRLLLWNVVLCAGTVRVM